jgi:simple sugar transport system permease protein
MSHRRAGAAFVAALCLAGLVPAYFGTRGWMTGLLVADLVIAVALVIFARWSPLRCVGAALLFGGAGAIGPALQSVGVGWGYHLFNTVPYVLTLVILYLTCKPGSVAVGSPGELSSVR